MPNTNTMVFKEDKKDMGMTPPGLWYHEPLNKTDARALF